MRQRKTPTNRQGLRNKKGRQTSAIYLIHSVLSIVLLPVFNGRTNCFLPFTFLICILLNMSAIFKLSITPYFKNRMLLKISAFLWSASWVVVVAIAQKFGVNYSLDLAKCPAVGFRLIQHQGWFEKQCDLAMSLAVCLVLPLVRLWPLRNSIAVQWP